MVNILTKNELLKAKSYSDVFDANADIAKRQFRAYMKLYHPDADDSDTAKKIYEIIQSIYNPVWSSHCAASVSESFIFKNKVTKKGFEINNPVVLNNGTCMVYHTATKVVLKFGKDYQKFYDNYVRSVHMMKYADDKMEKQFKRCIPKIIKHFEDTDGNFVILLEKTPEVLNLGLIVASYDKLGQVFPEKQAAWIMNRLFNLAQYIRWQDRVFNGFSLTNLWVSPEYHSVLLLGGFEYISDINSNMIGCPKEVFKLLPVKARDEHIAVTETDLECIKGIGRKLFKGTNAKNVIEYLDKGLETNTPLDEWELYGKAVKADFGKRKFIVWEDVPYNK